MKTILYRSERHRKSVFTTVYAVFITLFIVAEQDLLLPTKDLILIYFSTSIFFFLMNELLYMFIDQFDVVKKSEIFPAEPLSEKRRAVYNTYVWPIFFVISFMCIAAASILFFGSYVMKFFV